MGLAGWERVDVVILIGGDYSRETPHPEQNEGCRVSKALKSWQLLTKMLNLTLYFSTRQQCR